MDDLYKQALERREKLLAELRAVEQLILTYEAIQGLRKAPPESNSQLGLFSASKPSRAQRSANVSALLNRAAEIIVSEERPMTRSELVSRLEAEGHHLEGTDKQKVFGTNVWRSGRFWNLKGAGYWPKDTPLPAEFRHLEQRESIVG